MTGQTETAALHCQRGETIMVFDGIVHNGVVHLPPEAALPDGTQVHIIPTTKRRFKDLLDLAGTWEGDDAEAVVEEIYALRSSAPARPSLDA